MRSPENCFLQRDCRGVAVRNLHAAARNAVGVGKMPVAVDGVESAGQFVRDRIRHVDTHHEIRRKVRAPRPRVVEVVLCVQRIVANQTGEDAALNGSILCPPGQIGHVGESKLPQPSVSGDVRCGCREPEYLVVFSGVDEQFRPHRDGSVALFFA